MATKSKLMFPIGFDVNSALPEAQRDVERALKRLDHIAAGTPIQTKVEVDKAGLARMGKAYTEQIDAIKKRLADLSAFWDKLKPNERFNRARTDLSSKVIDLDVGTKKNPNHIKTSAKKAYEEYVQLIEVLRTFGQSLSQLHTDRMRMIDAELRQEDELKKKKDRQQEATDRLAASVSASNARINEAQKQQNDLLNAAMTRVDQLTASYVRQKQKVADLQVELARVNAEIRKEEAAGTHKDANGIFSDKYNKLLKEREVLLAQQASAEENLTSKLHAKLVAEEQAAKEAQRRFDALQKQLEQENAMRQRQIQLLIEYQNRILESQNARNGTRENQSDIEKVTAAYKDQTAAVNVLERALQAAQSHKANLEKTGKAYNADKTQTKDYTEALRQELELTKQLSVAEQELTQKHAQLISVLRQRALGANTTDAGTLANDVAAKNAVESQIALYNTLQQRIQAVTADYERLKAMQNEAGGVGYEKEITDNLKERAKLEKQVAEITKTAGQAQSEMLRQQEALTAKINARKQAKAAKEAEEQRNIQKRIAELKKERAALVLKENTLENINKKLTAYRNMLSKAQIGSAGFDRATKEIERLTNKLKELASETEKTEKKRKHQVDKTTSAYKEQSNYITKLIDRMSVYAAIGAIGNLLSKVREVTAQFELQRISLGAIIQDQVKANSLFTQIKAFALKSPISIMQLTRYTKQVAAYRIETDKLFDTTKRLADVSVGLGVDMQRLVLAYGQVKAATYLRASELRQFTEAGIPMLELLAEKFTKVEGHAVTTADVMKRIHDRGVEFKDVEQVFNEMTEAGGMFYNMQEKQGNTLFGLWAKLGDAASLMYDEIGNTTIVNWSMKAMINLLMYLMRSWKGLGSIILTVGTAFAWMKIVSIRQKAMIGFTAQHAAATKALSQATNQQTLAEERLARARSLGNKALIASLQGEVAATRQAVAVATWHKKAASTTNLFAKSWYNLRASMVGSGPMLWVTAVMMLVAALWRAWANANRLKNALEDIKKEGAAEMQKSVYNFESLANAAVKAADGSKQQRDALDELQRTYKDMIPVQDLTIERLRALKGNYRSLTESVKEYIAMQMKQKSADKIIEETGGDIINKQRALKKKLGQYVSESQLARIMAKFEELVRTNLDTDFIILLNQALEEVGTSFGELQQKAGVFGADSLEKKFGGLSSAIRKQQRDINDLDAEWNALTLDLGEFQSTFDNLQKKFEEGVLANNGNAVDLNTYFGQQVKNNSQIKDVYAKLIKEMLTKAGVAWTDGMANLVETVDENNPGVITTLSFESIEEALEKQKNVILKQIANLQSQIANEGDKTKKEALQSSLTTIEGQLTRLNDVEIFVGKIRKLYENIIPPSPVVMVVRKRLNDIVTASGDSMNKYTQYLMGASQTQEQYAKDLKEHIEALKNRVKELTNIQADVAKAGVLAKVLYGFTSEELDQAINETQTMVDNLEKLFNTLPNFEKSKGRHGNDTRLSEATTALSELEKMYNKYKEFAKVMSADSAYKKVNDYFKETIALIKEVSKGKIDIKLPKNAEEYKREIEKILDYIKTLPKSQRAQIEAQLKINDVDFTEAQEQIEKMLKDLSKQISDSKSAREFFKSIFDQSQDYDLAMTLTMSVYGEDGTNYAQLIQDQIRTMFGAGDDTRMTIDVEPAIDIAGGTVNYNKLAEIFAANMDKIPEKYWSDIQKIIADGRKFNADQAKQWAKDLANARTWAEKRVDLARYTSERIKEIQSSDMSEEDKDKYIGMYNEREIKEAAKLQFEAFKNTPMYVAMFNNLEAASTGALTAMRQNLNQLKMDIEGLDPTQLKEINKRISEINSQLAERSMNPFKQLKDLYKELDVNAEITENGVKRDSWAKQLKTRTKGMGLGEYGEGISTIKELDAAIETMTKNQLELQDQLNTELSREVVIDQEILAYQRELEQLKKEGQGESDRAKELEEMIPASQNLLNKARERIQTLTNESNLNQKNLEYLTGMSDKYTNIQKHQKEVWKGADKVKDGIMNIADSAYEMAEAFGASDDALALFKDIQNSINLVYDLTKNITSAVWAMSKTTEEGISTVEKASIILAVISTTLQVATALFNLFANAKARKLEKQIQNEQKLIDALSYSYDRLKDASEKLFGNEYINNYNKRLEQLRQMQESYQKQAQLERQKGKKADKDKIKEYENAARDAADQIRDMQDELVNRMTGTDLASAAKDFADAWRDAYIEFGNTANAISEKFTEMINNMVVESLMAKVVQAQLQPFFDEIDKLARDGQMTAEEIAQVVAGVPSAVRAIDEGLKVTIGQLQAAGVDIRNLNADTEFTGIARDIASASEESINGLAAMINTQNYYISHVPMIYEEIVLIRALLAGGDVALGTGNTSTVDLLTLQNEYLAHLPTISSNTTMIAERCERAMYACENIAEQLEKVIKPKGSDSGWVVNTNI